MRSGLSSLAKLFFHRSDHRPRPANCILSILPPIRSGVAIFNEKIIEKIDFDIDVYTPMGLGSFPNNPHIGVSKIKSLKYTDRTTYNTSLFIIGNSVDHLPIIEEFLSSRLPNKILYAHDTNYRDVLALSSRRHPACLKLIESGQHGIEAIFGSAIGDGNALIVHSERTHRRLKSLFKDARIINLFHPIFQIDQVKAPQPWKAERLTIGHFGQLNPYKRIDELLRVAEELASRGMDVTVLFAGFNAESWTRYTSFQPQRAVVATTVPACDEDMREAMRGVDVAIQFRDFYGEEVSGVLHQLVGVRTLTVSNDSPAVGRLGDFLVLRPSDTPAGELANLIVSMLTNQKNPTARADLSDHGLDRYFEEFRTLFTEPDPGTRRVPP